MFDRVTVAELRTEVEMEAIVVCAASFEERCVEATSRLIESGNGVSHFKWVVIEIDDDKSFFRVECQKARERNAERLRSVIRDGRGKIIADGDFGHEWPLSKLKDLVQSLLRLLLDNSWQRMILDITTMPKAVFFPVFRELVRQEQSRHIVVAYTRAVDYPGGLSRDFEDVSYLDGFVGQFAGGKLLAWIPILGFQGGLARKIYDWGKFDSRMFPIVGFPSMAIDRVLYANSEIVDQVGGIDGVSFCPIDDPNETYQRVRKLTDDFRKKGFHVTLSPLGTKLQSFGACIAAIDLDLAVLYAQPRTYHPSYSIGSGETAWFRIRTRNGGGEVAHDDPRSAQHG